MLHIHLQNAVSGTATKGSKSFSKEKLIRIVSHLENEIKSLDNSRETSQWSKYYTETILSTEYLKDKLSIVTAFTEELDIKRIVDLGTNTGEFAALFAGPGKEVIAADNDYRCIDQLHTSKKDITSLVVNLMHPSPGIGWMNLERKTFEDRVNADLVLALALMHHLCIAKNLSFDLLSKGLSRFGQYLLIEFIPIDDPKIAVLLAHRENIFQDYTEENFRNAFSSQFELLKEMNIADSKRKLFLMKRKIKG